MQDAPSFVLGPELPGHAATIESIHAEAFGPGRYARAAFRIREGGPHDLALSFVATYAHGDLAGSVRLTHVAVGETGRALLLGPLAVRPQFKNMGVGRKLMALAVGAARDSGHGAIVLVGDAPYYAPFGFVPARYGQFGFPGPVDPRRVLVCELRLGAVDALVGPIRHAGQG